MIKKILIFFLKRKYKNPKIKEILRYNISIKDIVYFFNKEFDEKQLDEIISGLINGFSFEEIKIYAKPELDFMQMSEIKKSIQIKIPFRYIELYIKSDISWHIMFAINSLVKTVISLNLQNKEKIFNLLLPELINKIKNKQTDLFFILNLINDIEKYILKCQKINFSEKDIYCYTIFLTKIIKRDIFYKYNPEQLKEIMEGIKLIGCKSLKYANPNNKAETIRALNKIFCKKKKIL